MRKPMTAKTSQLIEMFRLDVFTRTHFHIRTEKMNCRHIFAIKTMKCQNNKGKFERETEKKMTK